MIRAALQSLTFAITLAAAAVLGLALAIGGASYALGGVVSASFTTVDSPAQVNLSDSTAFALWGTGTNGSLEANLTGGQEGLISPVLMDFTNGNPTAGRGYASPPFWNYLVSGTQVYGAIHHLTQSYSPVGEGFNLFLHPADAETVYRVYMRSSGGTGRVTVTDSESGSEVEVKSLGVNEYGYLTVTGVGPLSMITVGLRSTSGVAEYNGANVLLGGVTASVIAVPEPEYWLAGLIVLMGMLAYWLFMSTVGRIIRDGDGDKRAPLP